MAPHNKKLQQVMLPLIKVLHTMKPAHRIIVFEHLDDKTRDRIYAVIQHTLQCDKLPCNKRSFLRRKLSPYQQEFRELADKKSGRRKKKKLLLQMGGGPMQHVLGAAIPVMLDVFR